MPVCVVVHDRRVLSLYINYSYVNDVMRKITNDRTTKSDYVNARSLTLSLPPQGEYSLNFIRGKFQTDRDIAVQPGHLPNHYLNSLTRHIKLNSSLRPRATPTTGVDPAVKNITLPFNGVCLSVCNVCLFVMCVCLFVKCVCQVCVCVSNVCECVFVMCVCLFVCLSSVCV